MNKNTPEHLSLYWSNICILHPMEKQILQQIQNELAGQNIILHVTHFGLGYPQHLSQALASPETPLPDMILTTDLEVFDCPEIFNRFGNALHPCTEWFPASDTAAYCSVYRNEYLLPVLGIPMHFYTRAPHSCHKKIYEIPSLGFGGIDNSAAKTVIKFTWERYGKKAAEALLAGSSIYPMPVEAFHAVRSGIIETAIVPSVFSERADQSASFSLPLSEGTLLLPSYACVSRSVSSQTAKKILEKILRSGLRELYEQNNLLYFPDCIPQKDPSLYCSYSEKFLHTVSSDEFYRLYRKYLPGCQMPGSTQ